MNPIHDNIMHFVNSLGVKHYDCKHEKCKWLKHGYCCLCRTEVIMDLLDQGKGPGFIQGMLGNSWACLQNPNTIITKVSNDEATTT